MPEYLKWAHTAVFKATVVIRSEATLLYAPGIKISKNFKFWASVWVDYGILNHFWDNLWFLMVNSDL